MKKERNWDDCLLIKALQLITRATNRNFYSKLILKCNQAEQDIFHGSQQTKFKTEKLFPHVHVLKKISWLVGTQEDFQSSVHHLNEKGKVLTELRFQKIFSFLNEENSQFLTQGASEWKKEWTNLMSSQQRSQNGKCSPKDWSNNSQSPMIAPQKTQENSLFPIKSATVNNRLFPIVNNKHLAISQWVA